MAWTWIRAAYRGWIALGDLLGRVNGTILLTVFFFVLILPFGVVRRLFTRDPLRLKWDKGAPTYRTRCAAETRTGMERPF